MRLSTKIDVTTTVRIFQHSGNMKPTKGKANICRGTAQHQSPIPTKIILKMQPINTKNDFALQLQGFGRFFVHDFGENQGEFKSMSACARAATTTNLMESRDKIKNHGKIASVTLYPPGSLGNLSSAN